MILTAFEGLPRKDHFEALGLTYAAPEGAVREAYTRFARLLHPDACRDASLSDLWEQREAVFVRICEAYETLRSPDLRAAYERELEMRKPRRFQAAPPSPAPSSPAVAPSPPAPSGPPQPPEASNPSPDEPNSEFLDATEAIRAAERLIKGERYWDAIQQLERVIPLVHGPFRHRARVALARACMKNPKWLKRADDLLQLVIRESPDFVEAYVALGALYRDRQLVNRAAAMYRKALELDPNHPEARQELTSLEPGSSARRGGSLRGLFGKI
jgi:tetratricopeptide (TPR) repeat protein